MRVCVYECVVREESVPELYWRCNENSESHASQQACICPQKCKVMVTRAVASH